MLFFLHERNKVIILLLLSLSGLFIPLFMTAQTNGFITDQCQTNLSGNDKKDSCTSSIGDYSILQDDSISAVTPSANPSSYEFKKIFDMNSFQSEDILANGSALYVAAATAGLFVYNVSDPANPLLIANYNNYSFAKALSLDGDFLFVLDQYDGIVIYDISSRLSPLEISRFDLPDESFAFACTEKYSLIINEVGLYVLNITNPWRPQLINFHNEYIEQFASYYTGFIVLYESIAYVIQDTMRIFIFDFSDPLAIKTYSAFSYQEVYFEKLFIVGSFLYASSSDALIVLDITNPTRPLFVDQIETIDSTTIFVFNDILVAWQSSLYFYNISNPLDPQIISSYLVMQNINAFSFSSSYLYLSFPRYTSVKGITILNLTNIVSCSKVATIDFGISGRKMALDGEILYLVDDSKKLVLMNVSDGYPYPIITTYSVSPYLVDDFVIQGDYLYFIGSARYLFILNISDPLAISFASATILPDYPDTLVVKGKYAFMGHGNKYVYCYNIANASSPIEESDSQLTESDISQLQIIDNLLYVLAGDKIIVTNYSSPQTPIVIDIFEYGYYLDGFLVFNDLIFASYWGTVIFLNATDPTDLQEISECTIISSTPICSMAANDSILFTYSYLGRLLAIDFREVSQPKQVACYYEFSQPEDLLLLDNHVLISDYYDGLRIFSLEPDTTGPIVYEIYHTPAPVIVGSMVRFFASAFDSSDISKMLVFYRIDNGSWHNMTMTIWFNDLFISGARYFSENDVIDYYVVAYDASVGNHSTVALNNAGYFTFKVYPKLPTQKSAFRPFSFLILSLMAITTVSICSYSNKKKRRRR